MAEHSSIFIKSKYLKIIDGHRSMKLLFDARKWEIVSNPKKRKRRRDNDIQILALMARLCVTNPYKY